MSADELRGRVKVVARETRISKLLARGVGIGLELLVNIVLPFLIYNYGEKPWGGTLALIASSGPPIAWSILEFACHRRVDALSILVLTGIGLSLLALLGGGGPRFLQLREKLVTAGIGCLFLGSAAIGRPLMAHLVRAAFQRSGPSAMGELEAIKDHAGFHRAMTRLSLVWGFGLVAEAALAVVLVFTLTVRQYLLAAPVLGYGVFAALWLWTVLYGQSQRRKGAARRAAEAAKASQDSRTGS